MRNQRGEAGQFDGSLDAFVKSVCDGETPYGSWAAHVSDWAHALGDERVLFLRYEDMLRDLGAAVRAIAAHLNLPFSLECVEKCALEAMRGDESRYAPRSVEWAPGLT